MFWKPCKIRKPYSPSSADVDGLLTKVDKILNQLKEQIATCANVLLKDRVDYCEKAVNEIKGPDLPMKDGKIDKDAWSKKPEGEQRKIWETLTLAHEELRCLNSDSLEKGKCYFVWFSILLVLVVGTYLGLHLRSFQDATQKPLTPEATLTIWNQARSIDLALIQLKEKRKLAEKPKPPDQGLAGQQNLQDNNKDGTTELKVAITHALNGEKGLRDNLSKLPLPFETLSLLADATAEFVADDPTVYVTYPAVMKRLKADLESLSTAYFWTLQPWRWVELAFWAVIGCLVGLLFYIAGSLGQGIFRPEEGAMFVAEILIAPIVVSVVFFLFTMTGITDFTPSQASVTTNIGVAFIFGFAIRRTIGLLDLIKKRFFPDPSPGSASPGG